MHEEQEGKASKGAGQGGASGHRVFLHRDARQPSNRPTGCHASRP
jgi:hypothetical protein